MSNARRNASQVRPDPAPDCRGGTRGERGVKENGRTWEASAGRQQLAGGTIHDLAAETLEPLIWADTVPAWYCLESRNG